MVSFKHIFWLLYIALGCASYFIMRNLWFPTNPSRFEKFIVLVMSFVWVITLPATVIMKQDDMETGSLLGWNHNFTGGEQ